MSHTHWQVRERQAFPLYPRTGNTDDGCCTQVLVHVWMKDSSTVLDPKVLAYVMRDASTDATDLDDSQRIHQVPSSSIRTNHAVEMLSTTEMRHDVSGTPLLTVHLAVTRAVRCWDRVAGVQSVAFHYESLLREFGNHVLGYANEVLSGIVVCNIGSAGHDKSGDAKEKLSYK